MKVSPLDLRQVQFRSAFRGFDRTEVLTLLTEVADDYEYALREVDRLQQEISKTQALLNEHREHERNLRNTLMTAQRLADEISDNAHKQSATIIKDAESRAGLILEKAQARYEDVQREIDGLRLKRREVESSVEAVIASLKNTLDFVREQDARDRDEKILLHRPRIADSREVMPGWSQDRKDDGPVVIERRG